ncbi:MAG: choice-of-anchor J domain-containing protein [Clostridia bacterium]|nr:choice-of-anchor J domain-containing protein [Clostridia bacterium]
MTKKLLSLFVAAMMVLSLIPAAAFASDAAMLSSPATEKASSPATEKSTELWDFEVDPLENGWQFIDSDGDGNNWQWANETYAGAPIATSGEYAIRSRSYFGGALTPDNWAISPAVEIPANADSASLNYQVASYASSLPETYCVYVLLDGETELANAVAITEDLTSPASGRVFEQRSADLLAYAGHSVQLAFRHYNCVDRYMFYIDDVSVRITTSSGMEIDEIRINGVYFPPIAGENPGDHLDFTVPDGANYIIERYPAFSNSPVWCVVEGENVNTFSGPFVEGEGYLICCSVKTAEGYHFADDATVYINGEAALVDTARTRINATDNTEFYIWSVLQTCVAEGGGEEPTVIEAIEILGFVEPVWGANPFFGVTVPEGAPYTIQNIGWMGYLPESDVVGFNMTEDDVFDDPQCAYFQRFVVIPNEGYTFSDATVITINGGTEFVYDEYCVWVPPENTYLIDTIDFFVSDPAEEPTVIEAIEILGFVEPVWGANPFFGVTVPEGAPYTIHNTGWFGYLPESFFVPFNMTEEDVFDDPQCAYCQWFVVIPNEGYTFSDATVITINGGTEFVYDEYCAWVPPETTYYIYTIDFFVSEPATGTLGDVDLDGDVDTADALLALRYVMGFVELNEEQLAQAEVTGEGNVSMVDCLLILRKAMELIDFA